MSIFVLSGLVVQIRQQMQAILLSRIREHGPAGNSSLRKDSEFAKTSSLVQLAIEMCLAIQAQEFLWDHVYPEIEQRGASAEFLEQILPPLWNGSITSLPPGLMQV